MFTLTLEDEFCAAHAIVINGGREPVHGHNWRVTAEVAGDRLDAEGLLCDFHALETRLARVIAPFRNADLNATPPFDRLTPTAEHVAKHIAEALTGGLPPGVRVRRVRVTEAPGCAATYWMP